MLAAVAFYPRVDSRFVGSWQLHAESELLPVYLGRDGLMTVTVTTQVTIAGPDGTPTPSTPEPEKIYQRWQVTGDKLVIGETGRPSFVLSAISRALEYLDVEFIVDAHEEFNIVSVSPDEIVLKDGSDGELVRMVRHTDDP